MSVSCVCIFSNIAAYSVHYYSVSSAYYWFFMGWSLFLSLVALRLSSTIHQYMIQYINLNCNAFLEDWPRYQQKLRNHCNEKYKCRKHSAWPDEIENVLLLLKLFPSKTRGVNAAESPSFYKSIDKLVIFNVVRSRAMYTLTTFHYR